MPVGLISETVLERALRILFAETHVGRFRIAGLDEPVQAHAWKPQSHWPEAWYDRRPECRGPVRRYRSAVSSGEPHPSQRRATATPWVEPVCKPPVSTIGFRVDELAGGSK